MHSFIGRLCETETTITEHASSFEMWPWYLGPSDILMTKCVELRYLTCCFPPLVLFFFFHDKMSLSTFQSPAALLKINFIVETGSCDGVHLWSAQGCICGGEMQLFLAPQDKQWEQWLCLLGKQYIFTFIQRHSVGWWWPCSCLRLSPAGEQMCRLIPFLWTQNF